MNIEEHSAFKISEGKLLFNIIGGSTLYGLNTPESDVDYRGIFVAKNKRYITGFDTIESIVTTGDIDSTYYEVARYLKLLRKSNTQVLELLFAPKESILQTTPIFDSIRENRFKLIDSHVLKSSLKGYVFSEIRLATGERSGQLGGKRKESVTKFGFSPKNFVQIFRLIEVGKHFYKEGDYMVKVKDINPELHEFLMEVKTSPQNFTKSQLHDMVNEEFKSLEEVMDKSKISFKFDVDLAADLVTEARQ